MSLYRNARRRLPHMTFAISWNAIQRICFVIIGSVIAAFGYSMFQVPFNLAAGGVAGLSIIVNYLTSLPIGTVFFLLNLPLVILGFFYLGRWRFLFHTTLAIVCFAMATELFTYYLPIMLHEPAITDDILLGAIYAGIVTGVGYGLIMRGGGNPGGTAIVGRIIQRKTGIPLSQVYLYTDGMIILVAGAIFGWEIALNALLTLFIGGMASDFTLEGPSTVRTATVITDMPQEMSQALMDGLKRGVSYWTITGAYTQQPRTMLMCTVYRPQIADLKVIVASVDPKAFVVIGNAHQAHGTQFSRLR